MIDFSVAMFSLVCVAPLTGTEWAGRDDVKLLDASVTIYEHLNPSLMTVGGRFGHLSIKSDKTTPTQS